MTKADYVLSFHKWALLVVIAGVVALSTPGLAPAAKQNTDWRIKVKSAAVVNSPRVTLGDIAEFYGELPEKTRADLSKVELWNAPRRGHKPLTVNRNKLQVALKHYLGDLVNNCILPATLTMQYGGKVLSEAELKRTVVKVLTPYAESLGGDYKFRKMRLPDYLFFDDAMDSLRVDVKYGMKPGTNQFRLEIVSVDGRVLRQLSGSVFLDVWKPVPCPTRPINRREIITPDLITWINKNMAQLGDRVWDGKGGPWRVKIPVGTGQPIMRSSIELAPVVAKGDKVSLVYKSKHLKLSVPVEVLEDAGVGEAVLVRNVQSKRKISAIVVNAQTVTVK